MLYNFFFHQQCNQLCGSGKQTRKVSCYRKVDKKIIVLNDDECETKKPDTEKACQMRPCEGVDWVTSAWSGVRKQIIFHIYQ